MTQDKKTYYTEYVKWLARQSPATASSPAASLSADRLTALRIALACAKAAGWRYLRQRTPPWDMLQEANAAALEALETFSHHGVGGGSSLGSWTARRASGAVIDWLRREAGGGLTGSKSYLVEQIELDTLVAGACRGEAAVDDTEHADYDSAKIINAIQRHLPADTAILVMEYYGIGDVTASRRSADALAKERGVSVRELRAAVYGAVEIIRRELGTSPLRVCLP